MMEQSLWYYLQDGQQAGPIVKDQLLELFSSQTLAPDTMVWAEGMEQWQRACDVPGFFPSAIPVADAAAAIHGRPIRPTSVTVLAVLCIVFGGLGLMCTPLGLVAMFIPTSHGGGMTTYEPPAMQAFMMVSMALSIVFSLVELAAGIGLLNLKSWARVTALIYGWVAIVWVILGTVINTLILIPALRQMSGDAGPEAIGNVIGGTVGGMCGGVFGLIFPIFLVIYMRKPHVIAACNR